MLKITSLPYSWLTKNNPPPPHPRIGTSHGGHRELRSELPKNTPLKLKIGQDFGFDLCMNPPPQDWNFSWRTYEFGSELPENAPHPHKIEK